MFHAPPLQGISSQSSSRWMVPKCLSSEVRWTRGSSCCPLIFAAFLPFFSTPGCAGSGGSKREFGIEGCTATVPKSARKGHPNAFRLDLASPNAQGETKFLFSVGSAGERQAWLRHLGQFAPADLGGGAPHPLSYSFLESLPVAYT